MNATYNITTNRLFLWPNQPKGVRIPADQYQTLKAAGLATWWPRGCFTGLWSPQGEDVLLDVFGVDITEDDTPDDIEKRVDRYDGYAEASEKAAAYAKERLASGRAHTTRQMRQAEGTLMNESDKAVYWHERIAGSIRWATYKDRPDVIVRRIKGLEKDLRFREKQLDESVTWLRKWLNDENELTYEQAKRLANYDPAHFSMKFLQADYPNSKYEGDRGIWSALDDNVITAEQAQELFMTHHMQIMEYATRWIAHLNMRHEYETEYLKAVAGGDPRAKLAEIVRGDIVEYNGEECEVLQVGTAKLRLLIPSYAHFNPNGRLIERENIGDFVRHGVARKASKIEDGIVKGGAVTVMGGFANLTPYITKVVRVNQKTVEVVTPKEWAKWHPEPTAKVFRRNVAPIKGETQ